MADIIHRIGIRASTTEVYTALSTINGLSNWWTREVGGNDRKGGRIEFRFRSESGEVKGAMVMEVMESSPQQTVRWRCIDGPAEWIGTDIDFQLSQHDEHTIILFGHRNWKEPVEFMAHCSMKWAVFLLSLREYIEKGEGRPSPDDLKIDNWN